MGDPPRPHALEVRRASEVVAVAGLVEPAALTRRLARTPAFALSAIALVTAVARIGLE